MVSPSGRCEVSEPMWENHSKMDRETITRFLHFFLTRYCFVLLNEYILLPVLLILTEHRSDSHIKISNTHKVSLFLTKLLLKRKE